MKGKIYALGVGIGNSEFLTLDAYEVLKKSDVVIVPQSKKSKRSGSLQRSIAKNFLWRDTLTGDCQIIMSY